MKRLLLLFLFIPFICWAGEVEQSFTYSTGSSVTATNLNNNFAVAINELNGNLNNVNADTANGFRFQEVRSSLPSAGTQGRTVFLTTTNALNFDTGSAFVEAVTTDTNDSITIGGSYILEGATDNDFETSITATDPTADRTVTLPNTNSMTLPSGAVFFMITNACPAGSTDVTSTYDDKFIRIGDTQAATGGADTDVVPTHAITEAEMAAHVHSGIFKIQVDAGGIGESANNDATTQNSGSTGSGDAHGHGSVDIVPSFIEMTLCRVD